MIFENMQSIFEDRRKSLHDYLHNIKKNMVVDIHSIINTTLINDLNITGFSKKFLLKEFNHENRISLFLKSCLKFYFKQFCLFTSYLVAFLIFKIYYKKDNVVLKNLLAIDVFFLIDNIIKDNIFNENYFTGLYDVLAKHHTNYIFLPRLHGIHKNPFKLIKFLKILNQDDRNFLFEFELLSFSDFIIILSLILAYPFKSLRLMQVEANNEAILFNRELIKDISHLGFDVFCRYIFGKNLSNFTQISEIYSWSEFQATERSFNYGIRKQTSHMRIYGCQLYVNYPLLNTYIDDIDFEQLTSPHKVYVNGNAYLLDREKIEYSLGVSLRYQHLFKNQNHPPLPHMNDRNILLLLPYYTNEFHNLVKYTSSLHNKIIFKTHPTNDKYISKTLLNLNCQEAKKNIYEIFPLVDIIISGSSGSTLEAVAYGKSVIIIADKNSIVGNPLSSYGKGEIWDIAFSSDDVKKMYNKLIKYRNDNIDEIKKIAMWYKENYFIEPNEENIIKVFDLEKGN